MKTDLASYSPSACKALRDSQGGYPALASLPEGATSETRLADQVYAADRAFLRHGMSSDNQHHVEDGQDHPLLHSFKRDHPGASGEQLRREFIAILEKDMYDAVRFVLHVKLW